MRSLNHYSKQAIKSDLAQRLFCWAAAWYLRLVHLTGRWRIEGDAEVRAMWRDRKPFIMCFWHNRLLMMPFVWNPPAGARTAPIHTLISAHRDGRLLARAVSHFGIGAVTGSDSRHATSAMRALVRAVRGGSSIGMTPDSPPGPRMRAKSGVVALARLARVPVIPATYSVARRRVLRSWDRLIVPLPFSHGVFLWGAPIAVSEGADEAALERARQQVEDAMSALSAEADRRCGHQAIEPGPPLADGARVDAAPGSARAAE